MINFFQNLILGGRGGEGGGKGILLNIPTFIKLSIYLSLVISFLSPDIIHLHYCDISIPKQKIISV